MLELAQKGLSIRENNRGLNDLGKAYFLLGDYEKAEAVYEQFYALPYEKHSNQNHERHAYAYVLRKNGKEKEDEITQESGP